MDRTVYRKTEKDRESFVHGSTGAGDDNNL